MPVGTSRSRDGSEIGVLLTPHEVSDYLGIPTATLANWRYQGRGPEFLRVGRHVRYRPSDVMTWVEQQVADRR